MTVLIKQNEKRRKLNFVPSYGVLVSVLDPAERGHLPSVLSDLKITLDKDQNTELMAQSL